MRVDKIILKAALSTLAAIGVLCVVLLATMCLLFPQTMMRVTYDMGMNSLSIHFASVSYDRSGEAYYAAFATEVSIGADYYDQTEYFGEKLIADDGFEVYCQSKNDSLPETVTMTYQQYIYGQVCLAKYNQGKTSEAVQRAFEYTGQAFPRNNPSAVVMIAAMSAGDTASVNAALTKMQAMKTQITLSQTEGAYLAEMIALATEWTGNQS